MLIHIRRFVSPGHRGFPCFRKTAAPGLPRGAPTLSGVRYDRTAGDSPGAESLLVGATGARIGVSNFRVPPAGPESLPPGSVSTASGPLPAGHAFGTTVRPGPGGAGRGHASADRSARGSLNPCTRPWNPHRFVAPGREAVKFLEPLLARTCP